MDYTIPTTLTQMYATLKSLYDYYRVDSVKADTNLNLSSLSLPRIEGHLLSDDQLRDKAAVILLPEKEQQIREERAKIKEEIAEIEKEIALLQDEKDNVRSRLYAELEEEIEKLKDERYGARPFDKSVYDYRYYQEQEIEEEISRVQQENTTKILLLNQDISTLNQKMEEVPSQVTELFQSKIEAKFLELKDEQDKIQRELDKYNNGLLEKEIKHNNEITKAEANLQLKILEIKKAPPTKEELVSLGYYEDVINVVTGYFNTLGALDAANLFKQESRLVIYLEDYYNNLLYMYQMRATS